PRSTTPTFAPRTTAGTPAKMAPPTWLATRPTSPPTAGNRRPIAGQPATIGGIPRPMVAGVRLSDVRDQASFLLELGRAGPDVVADPARGSTASLVTSPRCADRVLGGGEPAYEADRHPYRDLAGSYTRHGMTVLGLSRRDPTAAVRYDLGGD